RLAGHAAHLYLQQHRARRPVPALRGSRLRSRLRLDGRCHALVRDRAHAGRLKARRALPAPGPQAQERGGELMTGLPDRHQPMRETMRTPGRRSSLAAVTCALAGVLLMSLGTVLLPWAGG